MKCEVKNGELICKVVSYGDGGGSLVKRIRGRINPVQGGNGGRIETEVKSGKTSIVC